MVNDFDDARNKDEEMEESAKAFYAMLESSKCPLHEHTKISQLDAIAQVMALKAQFNFGRDLYDSMMTLFGRFLPKVILCLQTYTSRTKSLVHSRCRMSR